MSRTDDPAAMADRLRSAPLEVVGRFADASNATLLARLTDRDPRPLENLAADLGREPELDDLAAHDLAVYKPARGERPLWDFPAGTLHRREVAAHDLSVALGWYQVPTTVLRPDGPFGPGSLQRYVAHDLAAHHFTLWEAGQPALRAQLEAMIAFDAVCNNADRKAGHVLHVPDESPVPALVAAAPAAAGVGPAPGRVWLIDHGVTFHPEPKLRTVAWELAGEPVPARLLADLDRLREGLVGQLGAHLATLLADDEVAALERRVVALLDSGRYPHPAVAQPYPWPLL
ncbi:MAG: hypothetical protein ACNA8R_11310 [Nitriliruptoraceae bacterium]